MDKIDETFVRALFTQEYYKGYIAIESYMSKVLLRILKDTNVSGYLQEEFRSIDEIVEKFGFHPQSKPLLTWAIRYLEQSGVVQGQNSSYKMSAGVHDMDTSDDVRQVVEFIPTADIFIRLVQRIEPDIENFLFGRKKCGDILFAGETLSLWNDFFNNKFYGYSVLNYGAAYGITKWFSKTRGKSMLEVGSGTSGATVKVFQILRDNNLLDSMDKIMMTDIVPQLLDLGRKNISSQISHPPDYGQSILDINRPFDEQGFPGGRFDIIYGVNVVHAAHDLSFSLKELYDHLNEDGILVIAETIRPADNKPLHHEIISNLLNNYYDVKLDPEARPYHGYMTKELWIKNLDAAGFRNIDYITELDRHDQLDFDIKPLCSFLILKGQK